MVSLQHLIGERAPIRVIGEAFAQRGEAHEKTDQVLAHGVVKLNGDALAFLFLRVKQLVRGVVQLREDLGALGEVFMDGEEVGGLADPQRRDLHLTRPFAVGPIPAVSRFQLRDLA